MKARNLLILFFLIFLISCQSIQGPRGKKGTQGPQKTEFRTGTDALVLSFPEGTFNRLFEGDNEVSLLVEIQNKGAYPQPDEGGGLRERIRGRLWIGGFDKDILELFPDNNNLGDLALEGKSPINLDGGRGAVVYTGSVSQLPSGTTSYKAPIIVTATYLYKTKVAPIVCIDPNPKATSIKEKVCDIGKYGNIAISGGQGAPIAVTKVEEEVTSKAIIFRIEIQNLGKGLVISQKMTFSDPNLGYDWRELNKVNFDDITVGNLEMTDCRPSIGDPIQLINNKGFIICRLDTATKKDVYTTPLNIILSYGYSSSIRKDMEIVKEVGFG